MGQSHAKHMLFLGNPGTGKTTIALIMAKLLKRLGLLKHGQLIEAKRADLVAPYLGQTAQRTTDVIHSAMGGVLFIDEAYSLCYGHEDIFGMEALTTLLEMMEANRDDLVVILAGYPQSMDELLSRNPGLRSRFPTTLNFPDYFADELAQITYQNVCLPLSPLQIGRDGLVLTPEAKANIYKFLEDNRVWIKGNARSARNYTLKLVNQQNLRLLDQPNRSPELLRTITADDVAGVTDLD